MTTIILDGRSLGRADVIAIARHGASVDLDAAALARVRATAEFLAAQLEKGEPLYGVTTGGGLRRYAISSTYGLSGAGTIATSGWGGVKSLAYGGWWKTPRGVAEDFVALTDSGAVKAYVIPRHRPKSLTQHTLITTGWGMFDHLAAGECSTGRARTLAAAKPNGEVYAYLDADGNDQSGTDIRSAGRVATGWTGLIAD